MMTSPTWQLHRGRRKLLRVRPIRLHHAHPQLRTIQSYRISRLRRLGLTDCRPSGVDSTPSSLTYTRDTNHNHVNSPRRVIAACTNRTVTINMRLCFVATAWWDFVPGPAPFHGQINFDDRGDRRCRAPLSNRPTCNASSCRPCPGNVGLRKTTAMSTLPPELRTITTSQSGGATGACCR